MSINHIPGISLYPLKGEQNISEKGKLSEQKNLKETTAEKPEEKATPTDSPVQDNPTDSLEDKVELDSNQPLQFYKERMETKIDGEEGRQNKTSTSADDKRSKSYLDKTSTPDKASTSSKAGKIDMSDLKGMIAGTVAELGLQVTGVTTELHEHAHAEVIKHFYKNPTVDIQVDGTDNVKNFIKSPGIKTFGDIITMNDANKDGAAGVTKYTYGDGLNEKGQALGQNKVNALVSAAGCTAELVPTLVGFAAGFKLRKKHPFLGYTLMTTSAIHHVGISSYPFSALSSSASARPGHDWANFAKATGIPPLATAVAFAATLPVMGGVMYLLEKRAEHKEKERTAVARLVSEDKISADELKKAFDEYPGKEKIAKAEENLSHYMDLPQRSVGDNKTLQKQFRKSLVKLDKEYAGFSGFLAEKFPDRVEDEKKNLPKPPKQSIPEAIHRIKDEIKESLQEDKVGTALNAGTIAGGVATAGAGLWNILATASPSTVPAIGGVASSLIPGVGLIGTAASVYKAGKTIADPDASKLDKISSGTIAGFTALATAGLLVPGVGIPLSLIGLGGVLGTMGAKALIKKFAD